MSKFYILYISNVLVRHAMKKLGTSRKDTVIIGDRMDTDIVAGIESMLDPVLVLSGVTQKEDLIKFPYQPYIVLNGIGDIPTR